MLMLANDVFPSPAAQAMFLIDACDDDAAKALELARFNFRFAKEGSDEKHWFRVLELLEVATCTN